MDKMVTAVIKGKERMLNYSVEVMFNMVEKFGEINRALDIIGSDGKDSFYAVQWFAVQLVNDAELCRRGEGYDKLPMISEDDISPRMRPVDFSELRDAVVEAITLGYQREIEPGEEEEVDLGLAELNEKKARAGV